MDYKIAEGCRVEIIYISCNSSDASRGAYTVQRWYAAQKTIASWVRLSGREISYSAGIVFRRQNLTFADVIFWRLRSIPALKE